MTGGMTTGVAEAVQSAHNSVVGELVYLVVEYEEARIEGECWPLMNGPVRLFRSLADAESFAATMTEEKGYPYFHGVLGLHLSHPLKALGESDVRWGHAVDTDDLVVLRPGRFVPCDTDSTGAIA